MTEPTHTDEPLGVDPDLPPSDEPSPEDFEDTEAQEAAAAKERALEEAAASAAATTARGGRRRGAQAVPTAPVAAAGTEVLPWVDDRVSKAWVLIIVVIFAVIFANGVLFGVGGTFTPIATPGPTIPYCDSEFASPTATGVGSPTATPTDIVVGAGTPVTTR